MVSRIKACQGVYSVGDTANYFRVSKSTVHDIWSGKRHGNVMPDSEPANIVSSRVPADVVVEDGQMLLARGMTVAQAAAQIGIGKSTMYDRLREAGIKPCYFS